MRDVTFLNDQYIACAFGNGYLDTFRLDPYPVKAGECFELMGLWLLGGSGNTARPEEWKALNAQWNTRETGASLGGVPAIRSLVRERAVNPVNNGQVLAGTVNAEALVLDLCAQAVTERFRANEEVGSVRWAGQTLSATTDDGMYPRWDSRSGGVTTGSTDAGAARGGQRTLYTHEVTGDNPVALGVFDREVVCLDYRMPGPFEGSQRVVDEHRGAKI